jgi:hypothetical protein
MMTADDHLIYAQAKDKLEATKEFEAAVGEGKAAALQEKVSGDSQSLSCPNQRSANSLANYSLQDLPRLHSSVGEDHHENSCTQGDCYHPVHRF